MLEPVINENTCESCLKTFTEDECEQGALIEVENNTWKGAQLTLGYKLVCEDCYGEEECE